MSSNLIPQVTLREASLEDWKAIVAIEEANFSTEAAGAETIQKWIEQRQTNFLIAELNSWLPCRGSRFFTSFDKGNDRQFVKVAARF